MSAPLNLRHEGLTCHVSFDILRRRAGRDARPPYGGHGDAHKNCEGYSCGRRPRPKFPESDSQSFRSAKITAWRKAKAYANRRYLEKHVYAETSVVLG